MPKNTNTAKHKKTHIKKGYINLLELAKESSSTPSNSIIELRMGNDLYSLNRSPGSNEMNEDLSVESTQIRSGTHWTPC